MADVEGFVEGDTHKALRGIIADSDGARIDITGAECRLFAMGKDNRDAPTSDPQEVEWNGVLGVVADGAQGEVDFHGLGGLCDLTVFSQQDYEFQVKIIYPGSPGEISWTYPIKTFLVIRPVSEFS